MSKNLTKKDQAKVLRMFKKETKDGKKIASLLGINRDSVFRFLEESGLRTYSPGTYNIY